MYSTVHTTYIKGNIITVIPKSLGLIQDVLINEARLDVKELKKFTKGKDFHSYILVGKDFKGDL